MQWDQTKKPRDCDSTELVEVNPGAFPQLNESSLKWRLFPPLPPIRVTALVALLLLGLVVALIVEQRSAVALGDLLVAHHARQRDRQDRARRLERLGVVLGEGRLPVSE